MKYYSTEADLSFVLTDKSDISIKEHTHVSKYIVGLVLSGSIHITKSKELKHIITSTETDGKYSFHLVKIASNCSIKTHIHETQLETHEVIAGSGTCINNSVSIPYAPGVISIMPAGVQHEVHADEDGLYLFAKFIPALY